MKFTAPFLLLVAIAFTACETPQNRRTLYSPPQSSGPYTEALESGSWKRGEYRQPKVEKKKADVELPAPQGLVEPPVES